MGESFRNVGEITELAGSDLLTIAPSLLAELQGASGTLPRKLDPAHAQASEIAPIAMNEAIFRAMHAQDAMASDKLAEGIVGFTKALIALEKLLGERLEKLNA